MKVLQINTFCGIGSTGRIATDISEILQKEGNDSIIAYGIGENPNSKVKTIKIGTKLEVHIHSLISQLFDMQGRGSFLATKRFIKKVKMYDPDIIHLHNLHGCYINIKVLFKYLEKSNKPVIWTLHDCWPFTGHCAHFDYAKCEKWKTKCEKCIQKRVYPKNIFVNRAERNYKFKKNIFNKCKNITIITPSKWLSNLVKQSFLGKYQIKVINNGIDLVKFKPIKNNTIEKKYNLTNKFIVLGVASSWSDKKGLKYFVELSKKLDENYIIILVGITEKQKQQLPKQIITISKTNNVEELAEFYSAADVFVNPTLEDNFPTTNLEALACGTPIITFNTGGSVESIDKTCGEIIEKGNLEELYKTIIKLKKHNLKSEDCIEKSKQYDKIDKYREYIELYTKVIEGDII